MRRDRFDDSRSLRVIEVKPRGKINRPRKIVRNILRCTEYIVHAYGPAYFKNQAAYERKSKIQKEDNSLFSLELLSKKLQMTVRLVRVRNFDNFGFRLISISVLGISNENSIVTKISYNKRRPKQLSHHCLVHI